MPPCLLYVSRSASLPAILTLLFFFHKGLACSEEKFNDQLVCPLCDTVLPKDGTQRINLKLDDADLLKVSESAFGMQPKQLCTILQNGLDFWAQQQRNEGAIHLQALDKMKDDLKEEKSLNRKLSMVGFTTAPILTLLTPPFCAEIRIWKVNAANWKRYSRKRLNLSGSTRSWRSDTRRNRGKRGIQLRRTN